MQRDDLSDSRYGGNKVRKLEHLLAIAARRGGPVLTAGAIGSHHVVATAVHAARLGLEVEAVRFPQPVTDHVEAMAAQGGGARGRRRPAPRPPRRCRSSSPAAGPVLPRPGRRSITPGGRPPSASSGTWAPASSWPTASPPKAGTSPTTSWWRSAAAGPRWGCRSGSRWPAGGTPPWSAVRVADRIVTNAPVLRGIEAGVRVAARARRRGARRAARWTIDGRWFGPGYGHPTPAGTAAAERAAGLGLPASRPTPRRPWPRPSSGSTPAAASCSCRPCRLA